MILPYMMARLSTKLGNIKVEVVPVEKVVMAAERPQVLRTIIARHDSRNTPNLNFVLHSFQMELHNAGVEAETLTLAYSDRDKSFRLQLPLTPPAMRVVEQFLLTLDRVLGATALPH